MTVRAGGPDEWLGLAPFTGRSRAITRVAEQVRHLASTHSALLIEGEPGTGKGLAARAIHDNGPRRDAPFVCVDCGALGERALERELFGDDAPVDGALRRGRLELAEGGTLCLDDIDVVPAAAQVRLLRVLQEHTLERPGTGPMRLDVRPIAATRKDLATLARAGHFREDLLQRMAVARITMPPLRDRREDIPVLIERLLRETGRGRVTRSVTRGALDRLVAHSWPGNVRELRDTLDGMILVAGRGRALDLADLPAPLRPPVGEAERLVVSPGMTVEEVERQLIEATLAHAGQDKPRAAALLGIGLRTLYRKIQQYRIGDGHPARRPRGPRPGRSRRSSRG